MVVAAIGGAWVAGATAVAAFLLVNWYFTPPIHTFTISDGQNVLALVVFLVVAAVVSALVTAAARRAIEAARARSEATSLVRLAGALLAEDDPLPSIMQQLLTHVRPALGRGAAPGRHRTSGRVDAHAGEAVIERPEDATATSELPDDALFAYDGPNLTGDDRRVLNAFVAQLAVALASRELRAEASAAVALAEADALRTALLRAVSHDLRTPLASIKASASTLLADDLHLDDETVHQLHETIDEEVDRLNELVSNLLAMSRLAGGRAAAGLLRRRRSTRSSGARSSASAIGPGESSSTFPTRSHASGPIPRSPSGRSRTSSTTRCPGRRPNNRCGSKPRLSARTSCCG